MWAFERRVHRLARGRLIHQNRARESHGRANDHRSSHEPDSGFRRLGGDAGGFRPAGRHHHEAWRWSCSRVYYTTFDPDGCGRRARNGNHDTVNPKARHRGSTRAHGGESARATACAHPPDADARQDGADHEGGLWGMGPIGWVIPRHRAGSHVWRNPALRRRSCAQSQGPRCRGRPWAVRCCP